MRRWYASVLGALVVAFTACSGSALATSDAASPIDAGGTDGGGGAGMDAGRDGGAGLDSGRDAGAEGGVRDGGRDAGEPDGGGPVVCGAAPPRFGGALCGPGGTSACAILADDRVDSGWGITRRPPAIALDSTGSPSILWYVTRGSTAGAGMFSTRAVTGWESARTLFDMTEGGLVFDATDAPIVLASDLLNVDHYERHGADWALIERLPIDQDVDARTMRRDEGGCLYALGAASTGVSGAEPTKLLQRDSAWHVTPLGTGVQGRSSALALSPSGEPQVVWSEIIVGASYRLYWARGAASEELAWAGGSYEARGLDVSIGVSAAPAGREIPHVLFRAADAAGADELRYATRASDGTWSFTLLGSGRARGCSGPPTASGDSCTVDGLYFVPLTVVASGSGDVRLFWAQIAETGTLTGRCGAPGPVDCVWDESTTRDARLVVGTPGEPPAEVGTGLDLANATAALDSTGRIHIAASDLAAGLRYLLVGPATP